MARILVFDLGTSYFKFALFDRAGQLCGLVQRAPPLQRTREGRLELPAGDFERAIAAGVAELAGQAGGLADVEAVSFATQTNSFLLLDSADRPLTPIILWPDRRAIDLEAEIGDCGGLPSLTATTGIPGVNFQFMLAKLLWLRGHESHAWRHTSRLCLISDYLTLLLTGQHVSECGAAGLTAMVDIHACQWWIAMLGRLELAPSWLPQLVRAGTDLGPLATSAAARLGLPATCRFVVGCLDQYAGAIGAGNVTPELLSETTGTVLSTVRMARDFATGLAPSVFQGPGFAPGQYWRMAFGEVSANYLQWYRDLLPERPDFEVLTARAAGIEPGADGLSLVTDAPPSTAEAVFRGWTESHSAGHAVRCILEAVAAALGKQVAAISGPTRPEEIRSAGGAARSPLWLQIKADVLGVPVRATQCPEPTSLGAAVLAESALAGGEVAEIAERWVRLGPLYRPDPDRHRRYQERLSSSYP